MKRILVNYEEENEMIQNIKDDINEIKNLINIFDMLIKEQLKV